MAKKELKVVIIGCGNIGQAVVGNMPNPRDVTVSYLEKHCGAADSGNYYFRLIGIADSSTYVFWKPGQGEEVWDRFISKNLVGFKKWKGTVDSFFLSLKNGKTEPIGIARGAREKMGGIALLEALKDAGQIPDIMVDVTPTRPEALEGADSIVERIEQAFRMGSNVVLANKAPIAYHFDTVSKLSRRYRRAIRCEATVAAEIPFLDKLISEFKGQDIILRGIINGTTNFILSEMASGATYKAAFKNAKSRGLTEFDPGDDTLGIDPARKLLIISKLAGLKISDESVTVGGITKISGAELKPQPLRALEQFKQKHTAGEADYSELDALSAESLKRTTLVPKLVAELDFVNKKGKVGLEWLDPKDPLAGVKGALNKIIILDSERKRVLWESAALRGAGPDATANAIFCDCLKIARNLKDPHSVSMF